MNKKKPTAATLARYQAAQRIFEQSVDLASEHYWRRERAARAIYQNAQARAEARLNRITRECMEGKKT